MARKKFASRVRPAVGKVAEKPLNRSLHAAKSAKQDEFYTQYADIQKEVEAYLQFNLDTLRKKFVYCNYDDAFELTFFKYFAANFNMRGLEKLNCTRYDGSPLAGQMTLLEYNAGNGQRKKPKAIAVIVNHVKDQSNDGAADIEDVKLFLSASWPAVSPSGATTTTQVATSAPQTARTAASTDLHRSCDAYVD